VHELFQRGAVGLLIICGALTAIFPDPVGLSAFSDAPRELLVHRQALLGLLGAGLILAAFVPVVRMPMVAAAVLSKGAWLLIAMATPDLAPVLGAAVLREVLQVAALAGAGAVFVLEARREARWNGLLPARGEA
jgi:hypothetical protein